MIRILQFTPQLTGNSGIHHVLMNYYRKVYKDIKFDFAYFGGSSIYDINEIRSLGGQVYEFKSPLKMHEFTKEWKKFCRSHYGEYDIFENNLPFLGVFFKNIKKELGVKAVISHSHTTKFGDSDFSSFRNRLFFKITGSKIGDFLFGCTQDALDQIFGKESKLRNYRSFVVRNAFDLVDFEPNEKKREEIRKKFHIERNFVIANVGRFSPQKNHKFIIDVFAELEKEKRNAKLVLIGEGKLKSTIKDYVRQKGLLDKVLFLGYRDDISSILQGIDVFLFPSIFEGLGISAVEAQLMGIPTFISDVLPSDLNLTNYERISLDTSPAVWSKEIQNYEPKYNRLEAYEKVKKSSFNIVEAAPNLVKIYKRILEESN